MKKYEDIINNVHHKSKIHKPMTLYDRSAQFAPFAALTSYDDEIKETARQTKNKIELEEQAKQHINEKLQTIQKHIKEQPIITITYYQKDNKKTGGKYITITNNIKKIDMIYKTITLIDNTKIKLEDLVNVEIQ